MGFSLGQFIGGAAAAGVSNADEAIKHRDMLDLQKHQDDAAMMRQIALTNLQHDNSIDLAQKASDISANAVADARDQQSSDIDDEAQRLANVRTSAADGIINQKMQSAKDAYTNSNLSEADKKLGIDAADKYIADNTLNATPTDLERVHAGVNLGYAKIEDLMRLDQQDRSNVLSAAQLKLKERHEDGIQALNEIRDDHWQGMIAAMNHRTDAREASAGREAKIPAEIRTAVWLEENKDNPTLMAAFDRTKDGRNKTGISNSPDNMGGMYTTDNETNEIVHFIPGLNGKPSRTEIVKPASRGEAITMVPAAARVPAAAFLATGKKGVGGTVVPAPAVLTYDPSTGKFK